MLALLGQGLTQSQAAAALGRSPITIRDHLRRARATLGAPTTAALARGAGKHTRGSAPAPPSLSPVHEIVVRLVAEGLTNQQIAARMGLRDQTVKDHLSTVCKRTGVGNGVALAQAARTWGLASGGVPQGRNGALMAGAARPQRSQGCA